MKKCVVSDLWPKEKNLKTGPAFSLTTSPAGNA